MFESGGNRRKRWFDVLGIVPRRVMFLLLVLASGLAACFCVFVWYTWRASQFDLDLVATPLQGSSIYDSSGNQIASLSEGGRRNVTWEELPKNLVDAFVAREDEHFFEHNGVVFSSVLRSVLKNLVSMSYQQGASTITMQLARNTYELRTKSFDRKLLEVALTQRIEEKYDKKTIFTQYLNRIFFGMNSYGVAQAARTYFGKEVPQLNLSECATLAGLVRGPAIYNPIRDMNAAVHERNETLDRMLELGMMTPEVCEETKKAPILLAERTTPRSCSYAVMWVRGELDEIRDKIGDDNAGIAIGTGLNLPIQQYVEGAAEAMLNFIEGGAVPPCVEAVYDVSRLTGEKDIERVRKARKTFLQTPARQLVPRRGQAPLARCLQAAVLCVKAGNGNVLAVTAGRTPIDNRNRWQETVRPGLAFAPIVFCCASDHGKSGVHIVENQPVSTGKRLGDDHIARYCQKLHGLDDLPEGEALFKGLFPMKKLDLARNLFCILHRGRDYPLRLVRYIGSLGGTGLYAEDPRPPQEIIPREVTRVVAELLPFRTGAGNCTELNCTLPGRDGQWTMVAGGDLVVFLWMGFDEPDERAYKSRGFSSFLSRCSLLLARDIYARGSGILNEQRRLQKERQQSQNAS